MYLIEIFILVLFIVIGVVSITVFAYAYIKYKNKYAVIEFLGSKSMSYYRAGFFILLSTGGMAFTIADWEHLNYESNVIIWIIGSTLLFILGIGTIIKNSKK